MAGAHFRRGQLGVLAAGNSEARVAGGTRSEGHGLAGKGCRGGGGEFGQSSGFYSRRRG